MPVSSFTSKTRSILTGALLSIPTSGCYYRAATKPLPSAMPVVATQVSVKRPVPVIPPFTNKLVRIFEFNKDNTVERFQNNSIIGLRHNYYDTLPQKYNLPIDTAYKPYIPAIGNFGAPKGLLPNFGVDIFLRKTDSAAAPILAPTDGIIVREITPKARRGFKITQLLSKDGNIYSFMYQINRQDYAKANHFPVARKVGTEIKAKDTLGLVTPKAPIVHLEVHNEEKEIAQHQSKTWQDLNLAFEIPLHGQVNPLDSAQAGDIAKTLQQYPLEKGKPTSLMNALY